VADRGYEIAPWALRWQGLDLDALRRTESTFALSNGHIGVRGTFEEGEPRALPGTYLNGFYERRPLPYAETGYGYPEDGQTLVNVTNGTIIRVLVEDEPLDMRYGSATEHERTLDFRSGTLRRHTEWSSPTGRRIRLTSERFVSFTQRAVMAIRYEIEPLDGDCNFVVQSDLLANEPITAKSNDPRVAAVLENPLVADLAAAKGTRAILAHCTQNSELRLAAAMDHEVEVSGDTRRDIEADGDLARFTLAAAVPDGEKLSLTKFVAYGWSARRSTEALRAQVEAALAGALEIGWDGLLEQQRSFLDDFWDAADIEIEGDDELQQAARFAMFHVLQAGARGETRAIPAKGLTGPGYDGHALWDTETYVLPVLTYTQPASARDALRWRHSTLSKAKRRAQQLGQEGAVFPWRSIDGQECSSYWPAGTAAFHVGADIAHAVTRYVAATGDEEFEAEVGVELLVETARLWAALGHYSSSEFRIDGVTGPDEYTAVADNNVYTNLMAQQNLQAAAAACERHPKVAQELEVDSAECDRWRTAADNIRIPYDEDLGVHPACEGFTRHDIWDFDGTPPENYPLLLHYHYFDLYRKQVVKQADLVMAMYLRGDAFTKEQKAANFEYYEAITVRDSSLSACIQGVIAAEVGHLDLAYDYLAEAALTDLHDLHHNVDNGLHIASLAGAWIGTVAGFGGMRDHGGELTFAPSLPQALSRLRFRVHIRQSRIIVDIHRDHAEYRLLSGDPLTLKHHGQKFVLSDKTTLPLEEIKPRLAPRQPDGRAPVDRRAAISSGNT
jgi:alpha,alpha-trehalose phosphorylase